MVRRGGGREVMGRRPGARRDESGRVEGREGRVAGQSRPRKTAEELDAEMEDYWGPKGEGNDGAAAHVNGNASTAAAARVDEDVDMIE